MDASEVAVVGLGIMGAGIAEVFARAGLAVVAIEADPGALERGVFATVRTAPQIGQAVTDLVQRLGKTPVRVPDRAGFIVNALLLPYLNHAARLLETGYASREDIDAAATAGLRLPMGPLALLDLIGLHTSRSVLRILHAGFGGLRFAAAPMLRRLVEAGLTGRKTCRGFYEYQQQEPPQPPGPASIHDGEPAACPGTVTLAGSDAGPGAPLGAMIEVAGPGRALAVLTRMPERYGDPEFALAPLLAEHAAAGLAFR